jgi:hypothetical protein
MVQFQLRSLGDNVNGLLTREPVWTALESPSIQALRRSGPELHVKESRSPDRPSRNYEGSIRNT